MMYRIWRLESPRTYSYVKAKDMSEMVEFVLNAERTLHTYNAGTTWGMEKWDTARQKWSNEFDDIDLVCLFIAMRDYHI